MSNLNSKLFNKVYGCLAGGIIGDAMGSPTEGKTFQEIEQQMGFVDDFDGAGTDDSAIRVILCEAIIKNGGFVTADEFAEAFLSNKEKYYELFYIPVKNMFHKIESGLSLPVYAGMGNMHSSSSAMSISPVGLINACNPRQAAVEAFDVAGLIHAGDSTFCRDGACAIAASIAEAIKPDTGIDDVIVASTAYLHKTSSAEMIGCISQTMDMVKTAGNYRRFREEFYETNLRDIISDSRETVPCALALFYLAQGDPAQAIVFSANFGRDADTIGTMAGALAGAYKGIDGFKPAWIEKLESSFGKMQKVREDYHLSGIEAVNQIELARRLAGLIEKRMDDQRKYIRLLESLT